MTEGTPTSSRLSRRALLGGGAVLAGTTLGGGVVGHAVGALGNGRSETMPSTDGVAGPGAAGRPGSDAVAGKATEPFWGAHQSGIATPHQAHGVFLGFDLRRGADANSVRSMLRMLTDDAARLTAGRGPLGAVDAELATTPARLTVTFGFGVGLFDAIGKPEACPPHVRSMPAFRTDRLDRRWGSTDLLLQVCSEDPMTLTFAERRLVRDASDFATLRWAQRGFLPARGTEPDGTTPRNLMGMRDGTANESDPNEVAAVLWNDGSTHPWLAGGSQLVLRRIRIDMATWDDLEIEAKEVAFGRRVADGSPLNGSKESDSIDREAVDEQGFTIISPTAHAARAQARSGRERMIRRPYNYAVDTETGTETGTEEGLLFAAYQADLGTAFVPVQRRLAESDALNTWTTHIGSASYAIPPGAKEGSFVGDTLLRA
ncbi:Dyp-type peroxidase [Mobilicoccus pelagius]|uniref:Putative peroxidase n=1 Tax=Mobilicoccus pelagius NBRC 104925 TaxID=1089455 RepID=H5UUB2_9MICO|nr:Dyp-type peroxidase [Mobilicoccus pelagius]GAB49320.1 putative peroxidase [Mobilicoccus pelagius NBRC 104925]